MSNWRSMCVGYDQSFPSRQTESESKLSNVWFYLQEFIVVQAFNPVQSTVQPAALSFVRECLLANGIETLWEACNRPPWLAAQNALYEWYIPSRHAIVNSSGQQWRLQEGESDGQECMAGVAQGLKRWRVLSVDRLLLA